jgi:hypothetical protein
MIKDIIEELKYADVKVMPVLHDGKTIRHIKEYTSKFDAGLTDEEFKHWIGKGYNGLCVFMSKANPSLKCLDFDEKHNEGRPIFSEWAKLIDPAVYAKLAIERTRSNGYHVYFLCESKANIHSIAANSTGQETIALRGDNFNGITYCWPTPGYAFIQKSLAELETLDFPEMMQLVDAGFTFNRYTGKTITSSGGLKRYDNSKYPEPPIKYKAVFDQFDKEIEPMFIPELLVSMGWAYNDRTLERPRVSREMGEFIELFRPGKAAHERTTRSASFYYDRKRLSVYTDDQSVLLPSINNSEGLSSWLSPYMVLYYLMGRDWDQVYAKVAEVAGVQGIELPERVPMVYGVGTRAGMRYSVEIKGVQDWAIESGFMRMKMSADEDSPDRLVRVVNNIIYDVDESDIHKAYMEEVSRNYQETDVQRVLISFMPNIMKYLTILPLFSGKVLRDKPEAAYIAFNNGVLQVTKHEIQLLKHGEIDGFVFARDIKDMDFVRTPGEGKFTEFIDMITIDEGHGRFIRSVFGYLLHTYKRKSYAKAVMIIEDVEDQDEARGRSGKGLLAQFIKWIRSTVEQDGRNYKSDSQFKMQRISPWTQVFYLNDPGTLVMMQQFYNYITDDFLVELKGKKSYSIPFSKSPKILITTNFLPTLESDSDKDRFIVLPIKKVFTAQFRFQDAFPNQEFFGENWEGQERNAAVNFAVECLQEYLRHGVYDYWNQSIEDNKMKRLIQAKVPEGLLEMLELALETAQNCSNYLEFEPALKPFDGMDGGQNSLLRCFEMEPGSLKIFTQNCYKYASNFYKIKANDKHIGRSIQFFLTAKKYEFIKGQSKSGRYFELKILAKQKNQDNMKYFHANDIEGKVIDTGFQPIESDEDLF